MMIGKYITSNPKVCRGQLTFIGTRVLVENILEEVKVGRPIEEIADSYQIKEEAIMDAVEHEGLLSIFFDRKEPPAIFRKDWRENK